MPEPRAAWRRLRVAPGLRRPGPRTDALRVIRRKKRREYPTPRPLSNWVITLGALIVLGIAVVAWVVLLRRYGGTDPRVELDAIRTAGALVVGTGGAVALLLAARRQRSTELTLVHTERDATERRITELYTKAADQLGSDQAPGAPCRAVRPGALGAQHRRASADHREHGLRLPPDALHGPTRSDKGYGAV